MRARYSPSQDEVGTFSRGNLIPPTRPAPPASNEPSAADPFFEQLQTEASSSANHSGTGRPRARRHSRVFRSPRLPDPSRDDREHLAAPAAAGMPGSANLPKELAPPRRRWSRPRRGISSAPRRSPSRRRVRVAAPALLVALGALVLAGVALAAIVGGGGHTTLAAKRIASKHTNAASSRVPAQATPADLMAALSRPGVRHHAAPKRTSRVHHRHAAQKTHFVLAADRRPAHTSSPSSSTGVTAAAQTATQTVQPSPVVQQTTAQATDTASSSGSSASSGSSTSSGTSSRPAFGANGTLGPGHSPNG